MNHIATLPQLVLEADGLSLSPEDILALTQVRVQQRLSMPTQCELTFSDPPGPLTAVANLTPGTSLRVAVQGCAVPLFVGEVTAVEHNYQATHGHEIRVRGYDRLHRLRKRQRVRAHIQVTPQTLTQELVADLGLTVRAAMPGPFRQRIYQHEQSDLALLVAVTEQCGLYLTLRDDVLHLVTLAGLEAPVPLALGDSLFEARIEVNGDPACRSVTVTGWDPLRVETHTGTVANARPNHQAAVEPQRVGGDGQRELVDEGATSVEQAEALAQAELDRRLAGEVTFWGIADGDPNLRPATKIQVQNVDSNLSGQYVLAEVNHIIDETMGFVSEISTAPPLPSRRARNAVSTLGIVSQVDDPDELGRIRVSLPTYGGVESDWLGVLSTGLTALPNVGDQVLVLLTHEDPGQGIILGSLFGMTGAPDSGVHGGAVRRYTLLTPGGQRIQFDDAEDRVRFENSVGSYVELAPGKVQLHAATALEIEAPGQPIVIRGQSIDFQKG